MSAETAGSQSETASGLILVVGDWFVDDHWVVGTYRSSTSSRTGRRHWAALQEIDSATESLCGAGRTAAVLWGAGYTIMGVGCCAPSDQEVLLSLLDARGLRGLNPHTLRRWMSVKPPLRAEFINLGGKGSGTSRAIRVYERAGLLTQRLDWESQIPATLDLSKLEDGLKAAGDSVIAVVVVDLAKGLVRPELIKLLNKHLKDVPWFISTKTWRPTWLDTLQDLRDFRLLLVPEVAARAALTTTIDNDSVVVRTLTAWMATSESPSKGALALIQNKLLRGGTMGKALAETVVVVPDDRTVLALDSRGNGFVHRQETGLKVPMAMSSVLIGALTVRLLRESADSAIGVVAEGAAAADSSLGTVVEGAAAFTHRWRDFEARRVTDYRRWDPADEPHDHPPGGGAPSVPTLKWREEHERWRQAFSDCGVIREEEGPKLELWRAMTELPGYICTVRQKRQTVATLVLMMQKFARSDRSKQASCLVEAPAGAGKSHLIRCLAKLAHFRPLHFNVTQLYRRRELLDCFDRISTTQAEFPDTPLLIFFDEINADLESEPVYGAFLSPLEDEIYVRGEKSFHIEPAVWLFAGTNFDVEASKARDFRSRLTGGVLSIAEPASDPEGSDSARLERVYIGAQLLKTRFPEIEAITEDVLDLFRMLPDKVTVREIVDFTRSFESVKLRRVTGDNIPWVWMEKKSEVPPAQMRTLQEDWQRIWKDRSVRDVRLVAEKA